MEYELLLVNVMRCADLQAQYFRECIGQHMIAAYLAQRDFRARVFSGDILDAEQVIRREAEKNGVHYVGFYVAADTVVMVGNLIRKLKETTNLTVLVGGPQAASLDEGFLRETGCDYIIVGEGERPVYLLLSYLEDGAGSLDQLKSLRYLDANGILHDTPLDEPIEDLDTLPYPRRQDSMHKNFRGRQTIGLLTGRGCPFHCAFCYEGASSKVVRFRSIENVMGEIDEVLTYNPTLTYVNLFDDTFTLRPERVDEFCREIKKRGLRWTCEGHVSCIHRNPKMLETMIDAGLVAMQIGIESGNRQVLDAYQKHTTPEMIEEIVRLCHRMGLQTMDGNYIIGGAWESDETLSESLSHAKRLIEAGRGMMELQTVFFAPYFDTPITKCPEKFGIQLLPHRIGHTVTTMREPVIRTAGLSESALVDWKYRFDCEIKEQYLSQAALCTKSDIFRITLTDHPIRFMGRRWQESWSEIPHIAEFIQHSTRIEQEYTPDKYPIRTGMAQFSGDTIVVDRHITLTGIKAAAWYYADGRHTVVELSAVLRIQTEELSRVYIELNNRCLVYFSPY